MVADIPKNQEFIINNLKNAIHAFEFEDKSRQKDQISFEQFTKLKEFLKKPDEKIMFDQLNVNEFVIKNPMSAICAMNIGEFYF